MYTIPDVAHNLSWPNLTLPNLTFASFYQWAHRILRLALVYRSLPLAYLYDEGIEKLSEKKRPRKQDTFLKFVGRSLMSIFRSPDISIVIYLKFNISIVN